MKTTVYLIRHGESEANIQDVFAGSADYLLTEKGIKQAEKTAKALAKVDFSAIYSSPLSRARKTAEPFATNAKKQVTVIENLREINCGDWERMTYKDIEEQYPDQFPEHWFLHFGEAHPPHGESIIEAGNRFYQAVEELAKKHPGERILITAHAGVIRTFYAMVSKIAPKDMGVKIPFPTNASYSVVVYDEGKFEPIIYSEDSELQKQAMVTMLRA